MKSSWRDLFGSGSIEATAPLPSLAQQNVACRITTRLIASPTAQSQVVFTSQFGETVLNLHTVEAVDGLIADLIKLRDLMERARNDQ